MKSRLQKGEIGTMIALSVIVILGISSLVSSVFLSQKQTTNTKAAVNNMCPDGECPTLTPKPNLTVTPTRAVTPTPTVTPPPNQCELDKTSNQGCGAYTCAPDTSRQCKCIQDSNTKQLKWSCQCVTDPLCVTPTPTLAPTDVPADTTGLGTGSPSAFCPDGGIPDTGFAAGACDYGRQSTGNPVYIDKDNPDDWAKCIWVKYDGSFPYGQCHYANNSVCRRSDNVGGCAGVCNSTCCSDNSPKENGDVYDQVNIPGSSGIISPESGTGTEEFTFTEDISFSGQPECIDGANYIVDENGDYYPDGTLC